MHVKREGEIFSPQPLPRHPIFQPSRSDPAAATMQLPEKALRGPLANALQRFLNSLLKNPGIPRKIILGDAGNLKNGEKNPLLPPEMPVSRLFGPMPFGFSADC